VSVLIDSFTTIAAPAEATLKIQRSEFIGLAIPCSSGTEFASQLQKIQKQYFDATHHCWAYRLFDDGKFSERSSDAGEPSGTAGRPMALAISSSEIADAGVIVVRYYGGVKLGTGGLARAYRDATHAALGAAEKRARFVYQSVAVHIPFDRINSAYRMVDVPDVRLEREEYGEQNVFHYLVRLSHLDRFEHSLTEQRLEFLRGSTLIV
jgi:uncharacterized YigZ family protein